MATRSRHTDAVNALKPLSQDPQSESIADLVSIEVVRGPGVSSIGSVMGSSFAPRWGRFVIRPAERGVLQAAALKSSRALEDGVGGRTEVRVHPLQIAQDIQVQ